MRPGNASYRTGRKAICLDKRFFAHLATAASRELHSDGDMAAIGVAAAGDPLRDSRRREERRRYERCAAAQSWIHRR